MALIDKASLLMVPSTYEAGKLFNVLPSGNRAPDNKGGAGYDQTRADFDFDRGSNAAATRIGSDGLLKKYRENVLTESNNFSDSDWSKTGIASVTGGEVGYDGSNDAYLITASASTTNHYLRQSGAVQSGVQTYSVYAKGNGYDVQLRATGVGGTTNWVSFNLISGSVGTSGAGIIESKMTSLGNGWYRCSTSFNDSGSPFIGIYMVEDADTAGSGPSYTGDGVSGIFLQNAQVESSLVATDYLNSTSVTAKAGVLVDMPRINYDANGENGALLLEPSRANVYPYSEPFLGSGQTTNVSTYLNGDAFGIGVYGGVQLVAGSTKYYYQFSSAASTQYAVSFFVRRTDGGLPRIGTYAQDANGDFCIVASGSVKAPNDWDTTPTITLFKEDVYKFEGVLTTPALTGNFGHIKYSGNSAIDVQITGLQAEPNATYATSYIPNHGTSGGVTRAADSCEKTGIGSLFGTTGSTIYFETTYYPETNNGQGERWVYAQGNSSSDYIRLWQDVTGGTKRIRALVGAGGVQQVNITTTATSLGLSNTEPSVIKYAFAFAENDFRMYVNGIVRTDNFGTIPTLTEIKFNSAFQTLFPLKQALVFPTALTDSECVTLTTL